MNVQLSAAESTIIDRPHIFELAGTPGQVLDFGNVEHVLHGDGQLIFRGNPQDFELSGRLQRCHIRNLPIRCANDSTCDAALICENSLRLVLENVEVKRAGLVGLDLVDAWDATLHNVVIMHCGKKSGPAMRCRTKFMARRSNRVTCSNLTVERSGGVGILVEDTELFSIVAGSKLHGDGRAQVVSNLLRSHNSSLLLHGTWLARGLAPDGEGLIQITGDRETTSKIDVAVQRNCQGKIVVNANTHPDTVVFASAIQTGQQLQPGYIPATSPNPRRTET